MTPEEMGDIVQKHLERFTVMLAISQGEPPDREFISNGTGFLLDTGVTQFAVTNGHVHRGFEEHRAFDPTVRLWM